jgi:2-C-methyl-D-erythritol 4-phosphate cytidylyltransferase/2-C-methyl-D-erythritol 2,4-cyclodiphosphate synthase
VIDASCAGARAASEGIVVVLPSAADVAAWTTGGTELAVVGGATRSDSVRAGLAAVPASAEVICVHDAARPLATTDLYDRVITAVASGADGAVPGVPVADTIKSVDGEGAVVATPDRARLVAVQTPQAFAASALRAAHAAGGQGTDDASLVESAGGRVVVVAGEEGNRKITTPDDLAWARAQLGAGAPVPFEIRVGQGFDVHRFASDPARPMVLGGCRFEGIPGLVGHSDGDAVAHAVADALLGAAGLGDIGQHFPDTDPSLEGADSIELLRRAVGAVTAEGWRVGNADCSVVCDAPRLAPMRDAMQQRLSAAVGAPVTVKGRRPEGLGALGRGEGIVCFASAVIVRSTP